MISIIYGAKGSGKTKRIIDLANAELVSAKGHLVYITDTNKYSPEIKFQIRFLNSKEYLIASSRALFGFIRGLIAANNDTETIFIDGAARIANKSIEEMEDFFKGLEIISENEKVNFVLTLSCDEKDLPLYAKKYL